MRNLPENMVFKYFNVNKNDAMTLPELLITLAIIG
jgi:prepilin-type N-terminal cleavage/methylation domain-containing protein